MLRRIGILFRARNKEFLRDRSALSWNILFPLFVIFGFSLLFSEDRQVLYTVGVVQSAPQSGYHLPSHALHPRADEQYRNFKKTRFVEFIHLDGGEAMNKLMHHQVDLLISPDSGKYWVSRTSPKGYIVERLLHASSGTGAAFEKESVTGREIPYIEWLFPGILGMNMMFSALFGVGYVVVRYRKNGVLKRMSVTPTRPFDFLTAQVLTRMYLLLATTELSSRGPFSSTALSAGLLDLRVQIASLALMSLIFLSLGSYLFKWQKS